MGMGNMNKSKKIIINTTALKAQRTIWTKSYLVKVPLNVNIVQQDLLYRKQWDLYDDETAFVNFMKWGLKGEILILNAMVIVIMPQY